MCESQDGPGASLTLLVILNHVIAVAGNGMQVVEGIAVCLRTFFLSLPDGLFSFVAVSVLCHNILWFMCKQILWHSRLKGIFFNALSSFSLNYLCSSPKVG